MALQTPVVLAEPQPCAQLRSWFPAALQSQLGMPREMQGPNGDPNGTARHVGGNWP